MTKAKTAKKPKAKKAAVVWKKVPGGYDAVLGTVTAEAWKRVGNPGFCAAASDTSYESYTSATRSGFKTLREAKAAALDLAKLVRKWGKSKP